MSSWLAIIIILIIPLFCIGQGLTLEGVITDEKNTPLAGAMVIIEGNSSGNDIENYTITDSEGKYNITLEGDSFNNYMITIRYLGFAPIKKPLSQLSGFDFKLIPAENELPEVNVKAESPPIIKRGDTVTMNVDDFIDSTDRNVEDVLKKLPGVQIGDDGLIQVNGKNIRTVLVEDSDLLGHQYTLGTKNISATSIDQVQIIDHYQDNPIMKDVNLSEDIVLNLKLKESVKNIVTGSVMLKGGAGQEEFKNNIAPKVFYFSRKFKLLSVSTYKNAGSGYTMREIDATVGGSVGNSLKANLLDRGSYVQSIQLYRPGLEDYYTNNAKNRFSALRAEYLTNSGTKLQLNGYISGFNDRQSVFYSQSYLYDDNYLISNVEDINLQRFDWSVESSLFHLGSDENTSFKALMNLSSKNNKGNKILIPDQVSYSDNFESLNFLAAAEFIFKMRQNSLITVKSQVQDINENSFAVFENPDYNNYFSNSLSKDLIRQKVYPNSRLFSTDIAYLFNYSNITGSAILGYDHRSYKLSVNYSDIENKDMTLFPNDSSSLNVVRDNLSVSGNFRIDFTNNFYLKVKPEVSWNTNVISGSNTGPSFTDHDWRVRSFITLSNHLELSNNYRFVKQSPKPYELYDLKYIYSPYIMFKELIRQEQNLSHTLGFQLKNEDRMSSRVISVFGNYGFGRRQWTSDINFFSSIQEISPFYADGNDYAQFKVLYDQYIFPLRIGVEIEPSWHLSRSSNKIENDQNVFYSQMLKLEGKIYTKVTSFLRFELDGLYSNRFSYMENQFSNANNFHVTSFQAKLQYFKNNWEIDLACDYFSSSRSSDDATFISGNFRIRKKEIFSNENLNCEFTVNNLLNKGFYSQFYNDEIYSYTSNVELIKAHFLFGMDYTF